jgi:hypothetical protein
VGSKELIEKSFDRAIAQEAHHMQRAIIQTFTQQGAGRVRWAPLSEMTLALRRRRRFAGTKALIDRGDLRRSIKVRKATGRDAGGRFTSGGGASYFIGVHRTERAADGGPLVNIAVIHEQGARIKIFGKSPARIPARPFIAPVWEKEGQKSAERIFENFRRTVLLGGSG